MWTAEDRALVGDFGSGQALSDEQYRVLEPFIPPAKPGGRPRTNVIKLTDSQSEVACPLRLSLNGNTACGRMTNVSLV